MPVIEKGAEFDYVIPTPQGAIKARGRMVDSGNIKWIAWGGTALMFVEFKNGGRYVYLDVSRQQAVACAYAPSSGAYLNKKIKPSKRVIKLR